LRKTLKQKHTLLISQPTLFDFRLNLCKTHLFQNRKSSLIIIIGVASFFGDQGYLISF